MFRKILLLTIVTSTLFLCASVDARKTSSGRSRGSSSRGTSSRRTSYNPQPAPTSLSNPPPVHSAGGGTFGWQTKAKEMPVQRTQTGISHQSRAAQPSHSYPASQTGLSGNQQPPSYQQAVQQSHTYPQNSKPQQAHTYPQINSNPAQSHPSQAHAYPSQNSPTQKHTYIAHNANSAQPNTQSHAYPASQGLSGHSGIGSSNPAAPGGGHAGPSAPAFPGGQVRTPLYGSYPVGGSPPAYGNNYNHGAPPAYSGHGYANPGYGQPGFVQGGYGGYGGRGGYGGYGSGGFGGYSYGGMSRGTSTLSKVGIAGAGVGTLLTGLALWNLARSGSRGNTYIYQDHRGNPIPVPANATAPAVDPFLGELVNCTLTISGSNETEVIGIPCAIATSFSPNSDLNKGVDKSSGTQEAACTITVVTKNGTELSTTIPCSIFLNTAKEANVTEPPPIATNATDLLPGAGEPEMVSMGVNGSEFAGPQLGVPLAPTPGQTGPVFTGSPLSAPLTPLPGGEVIQSNVDATTLKLGGGPTVGAVPVCKLETGSTADPLNPCLPASGDVSVVPLANSTAAAA